MIFVTRCKCDIVYDDKCHNTPKDECSQKQIPVVRTTFEKECKFVTEKQCTTVTEKECTPITEKQCTTITEKECNANGCWDEPRQKCWDEPRQKCWDEPRQKCWDEQRQECIDVPRQFTEFETKKECITRPVTVCASPSPRRSAWMSRMP